MVSSLPCGFKGHLLVFFLSRRTLWLNMSEAVSLCRQLFSVPIYILFTSYVTDHAFAVLPVPRLLGYSGKRSHVWGCPMPELIHTSPADRVLPDEHHFTTGNVMHASDIAYNLGPPILLRFRITPSKGVHDFPMLEVVIGCGFGDNC